MKKSKPDSSSGFAAFIGYMLALAAISLFVAGMAQSVGTHHGEPRYTVRSETIVPVVYDRSGKIQGIKGW